MSGLAAPDMITLAVRSELRAVVVAREPLRYTTPPDASEDVPAHVRAASAMVRHRGETWIVQDDTNAIVRIDAAGDVHAILLPRGPDGRRCFDDHRGNKHLKLDLEAAVVLDVEGAARLVGFGSGSKPARERAVVVDIASADGRAAASDGTGAAAGASAPAVRLVDLAPLYATLRAHAGLLTSELNLEGALVVGDQVVFAQRGNGKALSTEARATCALVAIRAETIRALLAGAAPSIAIEDVRQVDLGTLGGARLTLTDLAAFEGRTWFSASAEDSPDAVRDGEVSGSAIGVLDGDRAGYAIVEDADGVCRDKLEGLALVAPDRCLAVVDADDPDRPAELLTIALAGF